MFILVGIIAVIEIMWSLTNGWISINLNVIFLFAGRGLLALKTGWRKFGLFMLWITMIAAVFVVFYLLLNHGPVEVQRHGQIIGKIPESAVWGMTIGVFLLSYAQYRVLMKPEICELFGIEPNNKSLNADTGDAGAG